MTYQVKAEPGVDDDISRLITEDREAAREAIRLMLALRDDPWLGDDPRARYNLHPLADCRRLSFDRSDWHGKPRYRLVYRNEPSDGAPELVRIWAVGPRRDLVAYARAAARIARARSRPPRGRT